MPTILICTTCKRSADKCRCPQRITITPPATVTPAPLLLDAIRQIVREEIRKALADEADADDARIEPRIVQVRGEVLESDQPSTAIKDYIARYPTWPQAVEGTLEE